MISIIVATNKDRVIGVDNALPWRLPSDLKHFKETTMGKPVIMGKKTFESIGRPLPGRLNIVLTDDKADKSDGKVVYVYSMQEAIDIGKKADKEIFVIGGAFVYAQAMPIADRLYVTEVKANIPQGNKFFPEIDRNIWKETSREKGIKTPKDEFAFDFVVYDRK